MPRFEPLKNLVIDRQGGLPMHTQVERSLRQMIESELADGDHFFTELELVEHLRVSRPTVRQALAELTRDGLLLRRPYKGTTVVKTTRKLRAATVAHVGLFLAEFESEYLAMLLQQIMQNCRRRGFALHPYYTRQGESDEQATSQIIHGPEEERLLVVSPSFDLESIAKRGYRTVAIESMMRTNDQSIVETDARMAVRIGVDYLRSLGHSRIALLVNEPAAVISVQDKVDEFCKILPFGKVAVCGTNVWDNSYQAAYAHMSDLWNVDPVERPTAIMTVSDPGAWAALRWLAERQIAVPGIVSVLGFEDARSSRFMHPSLSTIAHPIEEIARTAIDILWDGDGTPVQRLLAPSLMIRESTGPPPCI